MAKERRVLLVEDDTALADLYLAHLRREGVPVEHVASGLDADHFVRTRMPALVLIDLTLPDRKGRDLVEAWGADPRVCAVPVWIVSNADPSDNLWWHGAPNVQRYFLKSRIILGRLSLEIRAALGLPFGERLDHGPLAS